MQEKGRFLVLELFNSDGKSDEEVRAAVQKGLIGLGISVGGVQRKERFVAPADAVSRAEMRKFLKEVCELDPKSATRVSGLLWDHLVTNSDIKRKWCVACDQPWEHCALTGHNPMAVISRRALKDALRREVPVVMRDRIQGFVESL